LQRTLEDEAATARLGAALAQALLALAEPIAAAGFTLALQGDLGAGKTALVRALLRKAGARGSVKSPTFALLEPYELSRLHFYHFDFYRFKTPEEFADRGFGEYFQAGAVCLVEWPEKAGDLLPRADLRITLSVLPPPPGGEPGRTAVLAATTELGKQCLHLLQSLWSTAGAGA
jgi:tRNA threonylcarbamoyladenosine biosynthesis protein TsaE